MEFLAKKVHKEIQIPCFTPANGETITVAGTPKVEIKANTDFIKETMKGYLNKATMHAAVIQDGMLEPKVHIIFNNYFNFLIKNSFIDVSGFPFSKVRIKNFTFALKLGRKAIL